jgi:Uri superfamily endonuclease
MRLILRHICKDCKERWAIAYGLQDLMLTPYLVEVMKDEMALEVATHVAGHINQKVEASLG